MQKSKKINKKKYVWNFRMGVSVLVFLTGCATSSNAPFHVYGSPHDDISIGDSVKVNKVKVATAQGTKILIYGPQ